MDWACIRSRRLLRMCCGVLKAMPTESKQRFFHICPVFPVHALLKMLEGCGNMKRSVEKSLERYGQGQGKCGLELADAFKPLELAGRATACQYLGKSISCVHLSAAHMLYWCQILGVKMQVCQAIHSNKTMWAVLNVAGSSKSMLQQRAGESFTIVCSFAKDDCCLNFVAHSLQRLLKEAMYGQCHIALTNGPPHVSRFMGLVYLGGEHCVHGPGARLDQDHCLGIGTDKQIFYGHQSHFLKRDLMNEDPRPSSDGGKTASSNRCCWAPVRAVLATCLHSARLTAKSSQQSVVRRQGDCRKMAKGSRKKAERRCENRVGQLQHAFEMRSCTCC